MSRRLPRLFFVCGTLIAVSLLVRDCAVWADGPSLTISDADAQQSWPTAERPEKTKSSLTISDADAQHDVAVPLDVKPGEEDEETEEHAPHQGVVLGVSSAAPVSLTDDFEESSYWLTDYLQEPAAPVPPMLRDRGPPVPPQARPLTEDVFVTEELRRRLVNQDRNRRYTWGTSDFVLGSESSLRATSDLGSLLGKSLSAPGARTQSRSPNSNDPRIRGMRAGRLVVSGSYWSPAREDLDTPLDKIDSRMLYDMAVIKGPYTARLGPGLRFIDFQLIESPRFEEGTRALASTSLEYQTNGAQWYGRQNIWGGGEDWGFRVGYGHRTGNDYETGSSAFDAGGLMPASYNIRNMHVAAGYDPTPTSRLEFCYLRLDETNVEFPSLIYDINALKTDGYEVRYSDWDSTVYDLLTVDAWYNRTAFTGDTSRVSKNRQIPTLRELFFLADDQCLVTDVDGMSAGYRVAVTWGQDECPQWTVGTDLIRVGQQLNDVVPDTDVGGMPVEGKNFPISRSHSTDVGLFAEQVLPHDSGLSLRTGARLDFVGTDARDRVPGMGVYEGFPPQVVEKGLSELKQADLDQEFYPWMLYATAEQPLNPSWTLTGGASYGMRPPTLTELYAAGSFLGSLQPGLTYVEGDPELDAERMIQLDLGVRGDVGNLRVSATAFYAWVFDYITYDDISLQYLPPFGSPFEPGQTLQQAAYVNTDLATLAGFELLADQDFCSWLTGFAWMSYVQGDDLSRTDPSRLGSLQREEFGFDPDVPRSSVDGAKHEPLPGIPPLEARVGLRVHEAQSDPRWGVEFEVRMVDRQDRVAASLYEQVTPGFTILNTRAFWRPRPNFALFGGVENLGDRYYREHLDFRTGRGLYRPGINFYLLTEVQY
ncbi:MAG: TonB-dependent receptor [Candidatus Anammoximicrobium sp.]|nr:TonB-dependent receptor [Candidatus Anammoximicrobium sp.]